MTRQTLAWRHRSSAEALRVFQAAFSASMANVSRADLVVWCLKQSATVLWHQKDPQSGAIAFVLINAQGIGVIPAICTILIGGFDT